MISFRCVRPLLAVFLLVGLVAAVEAGITGTITVNTDADGAPADDGACTLREAVLLAHGVEPPETPGECTEVFPDPKAGQEQHSKGLGPFFVETVIDFVPALAGGTIDLVIEELPPKGIEANAGFFGPTALFVTTTIAIVGDPDAGITIRRGAGAPEMRLFAVVSEDLLFDGPLKGFDPAGLALENVTLSDGLARGGDGGDGGFEELEAAAAKGGAPAQLSLGGGGGGGAGGLGGAVLNYGGALALVNTTLSSNQAIGGDGGANGLGNPVKGASSSAGGGGGGGLGGAGGDGGAGTAGSGGGIDGGEFPGDEGFIGGGGAGGGEFTSGGDGGFLGGGGGGGAITAELFAKGGFSISTSASGAGGRIGGGGGGIPTSSESLKGESGGVGGFGAGEGTPLSGGGGAGLGGAVFNYVGLVVSLNSTFSGNAAIGGSGLAPPAPKGTFGDPNGAGHGGGIFNAGGLVGINNTTFSNNRADQGGGAVFNLTADVGCFLDKGECDCEGETEAHNSVFANSLNGAPDVDADAIDGCSRIGVQGDNLLIELPPLMGSKGGGGSNVITEVDPLLGPLADNGGPSNTHLPQPGSPVIDAVIPPPPKDDGAAADKGFIDVDCSDRDQRGVSRNQLAACDMGSVEVLPGTIQICKQEDPAPAGKTLSWSFEGDLGQFGLNHGQCTKAFVLAPDVYTVTELSNEPFFYLGAINCQSDGASSLFSVDVPNRSVAITLAEDENVVCTFVNEQAGTVIINKNTDVATAEIFGFNDDIPVPPPIKMSEKGPGPDFTLPGGGSIGFPFTRPGSYTVSEVDPFPLNFALASVACDDANSGQSGPLSAAINLEPGEVVECTFFNEELDADLSVDKQVLDPPDMPMLGDLLTYQFTVSNAGPGFATNVVVTDPLPPQLAFSSSGCATESPPGTVRWEVGTLNAGAAQACTVVLEIVDFGEIFNTALVVGDQGDPGNGNEGVVLIGGASFPVPALGPWGLWLLALALGAVAAGMLHRRTA